MFSIADFEWKRKSRTGKLAYNLKICVLGCDTVWIGNTTVCSKIPNYLPVDTVSYMEISQLQMSQRLIICRAVVHLCTSSIGLGSSTLINMKDSEDSVIYGISYYYIKAQLQPH